jgi:hypothetical protein
MVERNLVCERGDGRPIDPDHFTKSFKRLAAKAELDPARPSTTFGTQS